MEKRKVHFDIVIPDELDMGNVTIFKSLPNKKREEMHPKNIEDYDTCPSDDDPDFVPGIDSDDDPTIEF